MLLDLQLLSLLTRHFSAKKKLFSCRRGKMVVYRIFLQKISDSVKCSLIEELMVKKKIKQKT